MKTPQELNDDYNLYVENAVITLDKFFNEKIIQQKRFYPKNKLIEYFFLNTLPSKEESEIRNLLNDENIVEGFVGSCELFGWTATVDLKSELNNVTFVEKNK